MMDRNLGATSAEIEKVGSHGLLYQWGRKDPFLGSSSLSQNKRVAKSTLSWPSPVMTSAKSGTIAYTTSHPTTFIYFAPGASSGDWYYPVSGKLDDTRWQSSKTIYDPCPVGWRVPDGGFYGVWAKARGETSGFYNSTYKTGMNVSKLYGTGITIWYPIAGYLNAGASEGGQLFMGESGYWSVETSGAQSSALRVFGGSSTLLDPFRNSHRASGYSVRCVKD